MGGRIDPRTSFDGEALIAHATKFKNYAKFSGH
jgi:hypothetical protein